MLHVPTTIHFVLRCVARAEDHNLCVALCCMCLRLSKCCCILPASTITLVFLYVARADDNYPSVALCYTCRRYYLSAPLTAHFALI